MASDSRLLAVMDAFSDLQGDPGHVMGRVILNSCRGNYLKVI